MTGLLLDTNIWIALAKGERQLQRRLKTHNPAEIFCCSVVRAELLFGSRKSQRVESNLESFARLLQPFESLPFDDNAAGHYGLIRTVLEGAGTPIGANGLLIASIALSSDLALVTRNHREFARVPGLRLMEW
jgi:tRNA(fMet)-specific endonuclease VapC